MSRPSRELLQDAMGHIIKLVSMGQERGVNIEIDIKRMCFKEDNLVYNKMNMY